MLVRPETLFQTGTALFKGSRWAPHILVAPSPEKAFEQVKSCNKMCEKLCAPGVGLSFEGIYPENDFDEDTETAHSDRNQISLLRTM
mgnify:CR=1 FL=1